MMHIVTRSNGIKYRNRKELTRFQPLELRAKQQRSRADRLRRDWRIEQADLDDYPEIRKPKELSDDVDEVPRTEISPSFWDSSTLDGLARAQNVEPVSDVEDLFGTWPGDESDGFETTIDALRRSDSGHGDS